ncbi:hypothetical protein ACA910_004448 [Epithemia clementina (nom. ined.)]
MIPTTVEAGRVALEDERNALTNAAMTTSPPTMSAGVTGGRSARSARSHRICVDQQHQPQQDNEKPKHPLSPYNLFFQVQRKRIVEGTSDTLGLPISSEDILKVRQEHQMKRGKRIHRKTHGKIGFRDLARFVAQRWKHVDTETRQLLKDHAALEKSDHNKLEEIWKQRSLDVKKIDPLSIGGANHAFSFANNDLWSSRMINEELSRTLDNANSHEQEEPIADSYSNRTHRGSAGGIYSISLLSQESLVLSSSLTHEPTFLDNHDFLQPRYVQGPSEACPCLFHFCAYNIQNQETTCPCPHTLGNCYYHPQYDETNSSSCSRATMCCSGRPCAEDQTKKQPALSTNKEYCSEGKKERHQKGANMLSTGDGINFGLRQEVRRMGGINDSCLDHQRDHDSHPRYGTERIGTTDREGLNNFLEEMRTVFGDGFSNLLRVIGPEEMETIFDD